MADNVNSEQTKKKLDSLINSIGEDKSKESSAPLFGFMSGAPSGGSSPFEQSFQGSSSPAKSRMSDEIQKKVSDLELELAKEKERAITANLRLQEKEAARSEMENMFKSLKEQLRLEKMEQEMENERLNARSRIEILERRLGEMHNLLLEVLKEQKKPIINGIPPETMERLMVRQNELIDAVQEKDQEISKLQFRVTEVMKSAEEYAASRWRDDKNALESLISRLKSENEVQKREIELLKISFNELGSRHDVLMEERKRMYREMDEKDTRVVYYRFQELSDEIEKMRLSTSEIMQSVNKPSEQTIQFFRRMLSEREKELLILKEKIQNISLRQEKVKP